MDIIKNYNKIKNAVFLIDGGEFCFERDLIQVFNRSQRHHSVAVDLLKVFGLQESFRVAATVKLQEGAKPKHMYFVYRITMEYIGLKYTMYESGNAQIVTDENWVTLTAKYDIPPEATVIEFICYIFQLEDTDFPNYYIKDYNVEIAEAEKSVTVTRKTPPLKRQENRTVGVIRWDAYYETGTQRSFVSDQVARSLSPKKYHYMAPFFASVTDENKIAFPEATQAQFDREAEYAIHAGIDYFAYCIYRDNSPMSYARKQHLLSKHKDKIKMCIILGTTKIDDETLMSIVSAVKDSCYLRFDARPVFYIYDAFRFDVSLLATLEGLLKENGVPDIPYYIGMISQASPNMINTLIQKGMDAVGAYGCGPLEAGEEYKILAKRTEGTNDLKYVFSKNLDVVPLINCGRDTRPRIETPVTWASGYGGI